MTRLLAILSITVSVCSFLFLGPVWADLLATIFDDTENFIKSLEWKIEFSDELERLRHHENLYKIFLNSDDPGRIYISLVMLGLLKPEGAEGAIQRNQTNDNMLSISQAFALCRYQINYNQNYSFLETLGAKIQDAGGAKSLSNLNAVILMSFLSDKRFHAYAESLRNMTQEAHQREAINVAIQRHEGIINKTSNKRLQKNT